MRLPLSFGSIILQLGFQQEVLIALMQCNASMSQFTWKILFSNITIIRSLPDWTYPPNNEIVEVIQVISLSEVHSLTYTEAALKEICEGKCLSFCYNNREKTKTHAKKTALWDFAQNGKKE